MVPAMSEELEVRTITPDELADYVDTLSTPFFERPDPEKVAGELRENWDLSRVRAAYEGGRMVGTFRSWASELTVPGGALVSAAAIAGVSVLATHRRRGVLRRMIAAEHAAMRERGDAVGMLYASEYPIYGRFGYGPATTTVTWTVSTRATGTPRAAVDPGRMEIVRPTPALRDEIRAVFDAWRRRQPGEIRRRDYAWDYELGLRESAWDGRWKGFLAVHRDAAGRMDGYVRYTAEEKWEERQPRSRVTVNDLHALDDDAYAAVWGFLASLDWVAHVSAERRSLSERLPWLLVNSRAAVPTEVGDALWVRLVDLPRALASRTYEREGSITIEVADADPEDGPRRVTLEAGPDGATCVPATGAPDLTLRASALGAAFLGGTSLRLAAEGAVDEHRPGALRDADALFRTLDDPWCSTFF